MQRQPNYNYGTVNDLFFSVKDDPDPVILGIKTALIVAILLGS